MDIENIKLEIRKIIEDYLISVAGNISEKIPENYLKDGFLDSVQFIDFIHFLENQFSINFNDEDFQDEQFYIIDGLSKMIFSKINNINHFPIGK